MRIKAIVFDLDGILIFPDFSLFIKAREEIINYLTSLGIIIDDISSPFFKKVYDILHNEFGSNEIKIREIWIKISRIAERYEMQALRTAKILPKCRELFSFIKSLSLKIAIWTMSCRRYAREALKKLNIYDLVDILVSRDDFIRPKPYPDGLILICKKLNIKCDECIFIGDTELDIKAAKSAGVKPILYLRNDKKKQTLDCEVIEYLDVETLSRLISSP